MEDVVKVSFSVELVLPKSTKAWEILNHLLKEEREGLVFGEAEEPLRSTKGQIVAEVFSRSPGSRGIPYGVEVEINTVRSEPVQSE